MPKNEILPKIYKTGQKIKHTCLKSGPYCLKWCILAYCTMSVVWIHRICILQTQDLGSALWKHKIWDLSSGSTRSVFWKHRICILQTQDLHSGNTRSVFCVHKTKT